MGRWGAIVSQDTFAQEDSDVTKATLSIARIQAKRWNARHWAKFETFLSCYRKFVSPFMKYMLHPAGLPGVSSSDTRNGVARRRSR